MTSQTSTTPVPEPVQPVPSSGSGPVPPEEKKTKTYFVKFNQDNTSLAVANKCGYRLYSLSNVDILEQIHSNETEDACMVERLFSSSLVAVVTYSCQRKLKVCHFKKGTEICNYSYTTPILSLKLNRSRLVVCLEESLYIHNIRDMKVLHTIRDTPRNCQGLMALSTNNEHCFLAYPGSFVVGEVQVFDAVNLQAQAVIKAHDSPLAALGFSPCGTRLATASEKGTVIRIFSVIDTTKLFEFRRGVKRCVAICCLAFSLCGHYLSSSSNTETVHIFKLNETKESPKKSGEDSSWMGYLSTYLPSQVTDVFNQGRSFATAHLPVYGCKNVLAIAMVQQELRLIVATEGGSLYVYNIDKNGGDLKLHKEHQISSSDNEEEEVPSDQTDAVKTSSPQKIDNSILGSYAGILKGNPVGQMSGTESDKLREMEAATESPPKNAFHFTDDQEYPPLSQHSE